MRWLDRALRRRRMRMVDRYIRPGDRLLDVGCHDGAFLASLHGRVASAVGIDPLATPAQHGTITIVRGVFPAQPRFEPASFDCVTMLATLEHVDDAAAVCRECFRVLAPGGRLVLTVPHVLAHHLVSALMRLGVLDGMGVEGHRGFDVAGTWPLLTSVGFRARERRRFELGLNYLFVAEKP